MNKLRQSYVSPNFGSENSLKVKVSYSYTLFLKEWSSTWTNTEEFCIGPGFLEKISFKMYIIVLLLSIFFAMSGPSFW